MSDIAVRIMLPIDGRILTVDLDDTMTTSEVIAELLANGHLQPNPHGYLMGVKGREAMLNRDDAIGRLGLTSDDVLRILPATDAGN